LAETSIKARRAYTGVEEFFHCLSHGIGVALSSAMTAVLIVFAALYRDAWAIVGVSIFGASMVVLYTASTLYHAFKDPAVKRHLKKFDHIAIYYLIAGTYTPFLLVNLRGTTGWVLFAVIWGLAITGTIVKLATNLPTKYSVGLYLLMGWLVIFASEQMFRVVPTVGLWLLLAGGLAYTLGVAFYVMKKVKYTHAVWHVFVLAGTILQFFAVLFSCTLPLPLPV